MAPWLAHYWKLLLITRFYIMLSTNRKQHAYLYCLHDFGTDIWVRIHLKIYVTRRGFCFLLNFTSKVYQKQKNRAIKPSSIFSRSMVIHSYLIHMGRTMDLYVAWSSLTGKKVHLKDGPFSQNRTISSLDKGFHNCITMLRFIWCSQLLL